MRYLRKPNASMLIRSGMFCLIGCTLLMLNVPVQSQQTRPALTTELTEVETQRKKKIAQEKQQLAKLIEASGLKLNRDETQYYVMYSNLSERQKSRYIKGLDQVYQETAKMFQVDQASSVWPGQCHILMLKRRKDYDQFMLKAFKINSKGGKEAGRALWMSDGTPVIIFSVQSFGRDTQHTLVHECTHAFNNWYVKFGMFPRWLDEGLAEMVAERLTKSGVLTKRRLPGLYAELKRSKKIRSNFFGSWQFTLADYGLAGDLVTYLYDKDQHSFIKMLELHKQGHRSAQAIQEAYGLSLNELVQAYGQARGLNGLVLEGHKPVPTQDDPPGQGNRGNQDQGQHHGGASGFPE